MPYYHSVRPSSRVSEQNAQFGVRDWHLEFISETRGDDINLMLEIVELHFGDQSVDSAESPLVKLIREILLMQQIDWHWWEGHHVDLAMIVAKRMTVICPRKSVKTFSANPDHVLKALFSPQLRFLLTTAIFAHSYRKRGSCQHVTDTAGLNVRWI
jgi:hypothetical protein